MSGSGDIREAIGGATTSAASSETPPVAAGPVLPSAASAPSTASVTAPTATSAASKTSWGAIVAKRMSTKWITGAVTVLALLATAGFGGLEPIPTPEPPEIVAGESLLGAELEMTPRRVVLIDELPDTGVSPGDGERLLLVVLDVTNLDGEPRAMGEEGSIDDVRIDGHPDAAPVVARLDDATSSPVLQPGVPATLVLTWAVPSNAFAEGDDVRVVLPTATEYVGSFVIHGEYWDDLAVAGYATIAAEDVGAGAES